MHDSYIINYNVNIEEKKINIQTYDDITKKKKNATFYDVLTHSFECILNYNQILDISISEIENFIIENRIKLEELVGYCWPINYKNLSELQEYLIKNEYKYIKIESSYGMHGWILAKSYQIR